MSVPIGAAAEQSGLSVPTIRYYDSLGLVPFVHRDEAGRRSFGPAALEWLILLRHLRATGISLAELETFAGPRQRCGDSRDRVLGTLDRRRRALAAAERAIDRCSAMIREDVNGRGHPEPAADRRRPGTQTA